MTMFFASAIHTLYPAVVRTVGEKAFDSDGNPVEYDRAQVEAEAQRIEARQARAAAYAAESDPILYRSLRGEATHQDWLDAVEAIRARYPYPTEAES